MIPTRRVHAGLYIDEIVRVAREELAEECDYVREAKSQTRFAALLAEASVFESQRG